ncbi:MAG: xanthine dehydrogenase family protein molybdopterin-binding subunit [Dehalococcoidales bacterium]|nr:xanthine dehydrogenase family protein molybdopterin-binding subunit [Dehalococcoidales bacterium]
MIDAREKVTGKLEYGTDVVLPGMLHGKVLRSPLPHARILNIDVSKALRLLGVRTVVTGADAPAMPYTVAGQVLYDEHLLAREKVRYIGDEVAAVAATDPDVAEEAVSLIEVEYEPLPAVFDPEEAMQEGAPLVHEAHGSNIANYMNFSRGDVEAAFARADAIYEGRYVTNLQHHGYIEPHSAVAEWDSSGRLTLYIPMQAPTLARMTYASALGISPERIRVVQCHIGGAFGGKLEYKLHPLCALVALKAGRPVKMVNTRREEFTASLPRMPMVMYIKVAGLADGTIIGKSLRVVADNGAYNNYGPGIMLSALLRHDNLYRIPNLHAEGILLYTNKVATGPFRGFGNPQGIFAFESALDMLAEKLGVDPVGLRLKNASQKDDLTSHGWKLSSCGLSECIRSAAGAVNWTGKRGAHGTGRKRRGVGIACCLHVSGNRSFLPFFDGSSAYIRINQEGKAKIFTSETDLGQGSRTTFAQIAAEEIGLNVEDMAVALVDTDISPHGMGTWGDRATTLGGNAIRAAAIDARRQLNEIAAADLEANPKDIVAENGRLYVAGAPDRSITIAEAAKIFSYKQAGAILTGQGSYVPDDIVSVIDPKTKYGNISVAYPYAVQAVEVEVDTQTGEIEILNLAAAHDLGRVINPSAARGQVEGAVAQGIGYGLTEEMKVENGKVRNASFKRYDVLRAPDMPKMTIEFVESDDPNGPFGAKGLAEPALNPTATAIANAVHDAIGVRLHELPLTPERVLVALRKKTEV